MKISFILTAFFAAMLLPAFCTASEMVVIGNPPVSTSAFILKDVKNSFLGIKTKRDDCSKIIFVIQKDTSVHENFLENHVAKSPHQIFIYLNKKVFNDNGFSLQSLYSNQEMIKFASDTKGAIGYVSLIANLDNVKTISLK